MKVPPVSGVPGSPTSFPGLLGRGLIEGRDVRRLASFRVPPFPGLLGRGLIEGSAAAGLVHQLVGLSPVYWAGASLKDIDWDDTGNASISFPRSTGPGPH